MKNFFLPLSVFVAGASILALEILGTRILGPFYGVSLYLWSALIATTLIALSAGYCLGGWMADRRATYARLSALLLGAGLWVLIVPWIRGPVLTVGESLGLRTAVFVTAVLLFFPPLTLLAMMSPLAVRLRATTLTVVGRSAGNLSAISTVAGVVSALATGFFFIPALGVTALTLLIGALLIATGLVGVITNREAGRTTVVAAIVGALVVLALAVLSMRRVGGSALAEVQSPYAELRVEDSEDGRCLVVDGVVHSQADTATWVSPLEYVAVMDLPRYMFDRRGTALLLGLGGGSIVKNYVTDRWTVDAVEIDPDVVRLAQAYFGLRPEEATLFTMDGRRYLRETSKKYDVVLIDVFGSSSIPFHMVSAEAFGQCRQSLEPDGVLAINLWAIGWNDRIVRSIAATLRAHFTDVVALPIAEPPDMLGNVVLVASDRNLDLKRDVERDYWDRNYRFGPKYQRVHAWDNRFSPESHGVDIITDDRNPVDLLSEVINYAARRELRARMKE